MRQYDKVDAFIFGGYLLGMVIGIYDTVILTNPWLGLSEFLMVAGATVTIALIVGVVDGQLKDHYQK
jgi:hypothetical protein